MLFHYILVSLLGTVFSTYPSIWQYLEVHFSWHNWGWGECYWHLVVEARDAAQRPTLRRTTPQQRMIWLKSPSVAVEILCVSPFKPGRIIPLPYLWPPYVISTFLEHLMDMWITWRSSESPIPHFGLILNKDLVKYNHQSF